MNQQNQLGNLFTAPKRVKKNASYFRLEARRAISGHWGDVAFVAFLAFLLGATVMGGVNVDITTLLLGIEMTPTLLGFMAGGVALFLIFFASPIKIAYQRAMLNLLDNGEDPTARGLFSCFRGCYRKSVLLNAIYLAITILPAMGMYVGAGLMMNNVLEDVSRTVIDEAGVETLVLDPNAAFWTAFVIALVLCALAIVWSCLLSYVYRYCFVVMAEYPEVGAVEALRMARNLMRGRKWKLFCLDISFVGWLLLGLYTFGFGLLFVIPYRETALLAFYDEAANRSSAKEVEFPSLDPDDYIEQ